MSAEDDIDLFIKEQKKKIAREREDLQHSNGKQISAPLPNGIRNGDVALKENFPPSAPANHLKSPKQSADVGLPLGNYLTTKEKLQRERQEEYKKFIQEKNNRSSSKRTDLGGDGMSLPIGERLSAQDRARMQRNKEYNEFLKQKGESRRKGQDSVPEKPSERGQQHPGSGVNGYSNQQPSDGYNQQPSNGYNQQPSNGYNQQGNDYYRPQREASSQTPVPRGHDDLPPRPPRKGWGTPQPYDYEDMLRRRREEEMRYRRYDDFDSYRPRLKPAHSDPYLNRFDDDGRRSTRPEYYDDYDRRRVRFSDEVTPPAPRDGPPYTDRAPKPRQRESFEEPVVYDWSRSKAGRSRTFTDGDRPKPALRQDDPDRPPRAKSATLAGDTGGLPLGQRDTGSATRRKKEQYRKELEQQMEETKAAKQREKAINRNPGFPGSTKAPAASNSSGRQPLPQGQAGTQQQQPPAQRYTPSFHQQPYGNRPSPASATPYPAGQFGIQDVQSQVPLYGAGPGPYSQRAALDQPIGDLGLKEAMAKSQPELLDRPFSLNYPQPSTLNQPSTNTDPYMYYGMRNPLEPDPTPNLVTGLPHPTTATGSATVPPLSNLNSPLMERYLLLQQQQQQLLQQQQQLEQQFPSSLTGPNQLSQQLNNPVLSKQAAAQFRGESAIKNFVGDNNLSPRSQANAPSYREQLLLQMKEKDAKKNAEIAAKAAYEAKIEKEIEIYDPWGKGGGGAPMRDKQGKVVADLKQLHNRNETILNDPKRKDLQLYSESSKAPPANPAAVPGQEVSPLLAAAASAGGGVGAGLAPGPAYGKIKGSITGAAPDPTADASRNEYQDQLRQQVEEKKRRENEEKEKIRIEEEKEERRLAAQRERIQKEYEAELERKKQKEEIQRKQKEDLEKQLEDKRKEAEEKKKEANEKRRREAEEKLRHRDINHNVNNLTQPRGASPPIPTLRTKEPELQRISSPPIPTHQKKETKRPPPQPVARSTQSPPIPTLQKKDKMPDEPESKGSLLDSGLFPETKGGFEAAYKKQRYLVDWLREIDPDLVVYAAPLAENGYKTWNTIRRLKRSTLLELCPDIKHGHIEAILHEVSRGQTPRSKKPQVTSPDSLSEQELDIADIESSKTRPAPIRRKEKPRRDDDFPSTSERSSSPPVPAVSTKERGGPKDEKNVMGALSAMRVQLAYEQQRIQSQLDKHRDYDPYNPMPKAAHAPRRGSPQVDVFELARHKGSVAVLRNPTHQAAEDFDGLKNRSGSRTRQQLKEKYPNKPDSDVTLEAQQMALLREQQKKLEELRKVYGKGRKATTNDIPSMKDIGRGSPAIPLDSDSAFIGLDSGETHIPKTPSRPTRSSAVPSPVDSQPRKKTGRSVSRLDDDDLDKIIAKSQARSDAIETLHDHDSDPDDILNKFLSKKSYDSRPPSGKSEDLSLWLKPSLGQI